MKKKSFLTVTCGVLLGMFLAACAVTDHTDDAVEKARAFALDKTRDLSEYQRNVIRYSLPKVLEEDIFAFKPIPLTEFGHVPRNAKIKPHDTKHLDHQAISFVWDVPSLGGEVIVYGTGDRMMRFWEPVRVLYRKLAKTDFPYETAKNAVVEFTADNMLYISETERSRIRFSEAIVYCTSFDLAYLQEKKALGTENAWEKYLQEKKSGKKDRFQLSLVWQADDPAKVIVFTGLGADIPDAKALENAGKAKGSPEDKEITLLSGWQILCVHVMDKRKFMKYTVDLTGQKVKAKTVPEAKK